MTGIILSEPINEIYSNFYVQFCQVVLKIEMALCRNHIYKYTTFVFLQSNCQKQQFLALMLFNETNCFVSKLLIISLLRFYILNYNIYATPKQINILSPKYIKN